MGSKLCSHPMPMNEKRVVGAMLEPMRASTEERHTFLAEASPRQGGAQRAQKGEIDDRNCMWSAWLWCRVHPNRPPTREAISFVLYNPFLREQKNGKYVFLREIFDFFIGKFKQSSNEKHPLYKRLEIRSAYFV